jgi:hypothetical protein
MARMQLAMIAVFVIGCSKQPADQSFELAAKWDGTLHDRIPEPIRNALIKSAEFELYSLDPKFHEVGHPKEFYRRKVIGTTNVSDAEVRRRILAALTSGVAEEVNSTGPKGIACFDPRHAVRLKLDGKSYYILICFECHHVYCFVNDELDEKLYFPISETPLVTFNSVMSAAGLPLAEPAGLAE